MFSASFAIKATIPRTFLELADAVDDPSGIPTEAIATPTVKSDADIPAR